MKDLRLNPQEYDIEVRVTERPEPGLATVVVKLGRESTDSILNSDECAKIGHWFTKLSGDLKRDAKKENIA